MMEKGTSLGRISERITLPTVVSTNSPSSLIYQLKENTKNFPFIKVKTSPQKGKISQINYILKDTKNPVVVITDVDGIMQKDTLKKLVKELKEKDVGVVGAFVMPQNACPEEYQYWKGNYVSFVVEGKYVFIVTVQMLTDDDAHIQFHKMNIKY